MVFYNNIIYENMLKDNYYKNFIKNAKLFKYNDLNENLGNRVFKIQKKYYIVSDGTEKEIRIKKVKTICNILRNVNPNKNFNLNKSINTNILLIIKKFKNTNLENILQVYKKKMFNLNVMNFLMLINNNTEIRNDINNSMKLFIYNYNNDKNDKNEILKSLIYRYPVYFSDPEYKYFNNINILGYSEKNIIEVNNNYRYGILGKCYKEQYSTFWMYHIWGINLKSKITNDYKIHYNEIINKYNDYENSYYYMYRKIINSVYKAAESLLNKNDKYIHIKFPLVGMYSLIEIQDITIKRNIIDKLLKLIYDKFIVENNNNKILFTLSINVNYDLLRNFGITYDSHKYINYRGNQYNEFNNFLDKVTKINTFSDEANRQKRNIYPVLDWRILSNIESLRNIIKWNSYSYFKNNFADNNLYDTSKINKEHILMLVNEWNSKSFIGNGLKHDDSINGFSVAGHGIGEELINSSYFHNPFLSPSLLDSNNWIYLEDFK